MKAEQERLPRMKKLDEDRCWQAVITRDSRYNGVFVYAVRSTGIYCRPSCPARRPRLSQAAFFPSAGAAEHAGFRACLRCRPQDGEIRDPSAKLIEDACRYIEGHDSSGGALTLAAIGDYVQRSPYHLQRIFKRITGITPHQYAEASRLGRLKPLMKKGNNVTDALYRAGYGSSSRLYERSSGQLGMTPGTYQRGGRDMQIKYAIADSPLGRLLVAMTEKGVAAVSLGSSDDALESALVAEYPAAEICRDDTHLESFLELLLKHLSGAQPHLDLPLDVQATAFQWRVYKALQAIPYGATRSYEEIARTIGQPTAARAVAKACASNPTALVIPCHRVVCKNGSLSGYRWGVARKRELLAREAKSHASSLSDNTRE